MLQRTTPLLILALFTGPVDLLAQRDVSVLWRAETGG
jgi:hypothetical protein